MSKKEHKKLQKTVKAKNKERKKAAKGKQMSGKGDTPRPMDLDRYRENFEKIFSNPAIDNLLSKEGGEEMFDDIVGQIHKQKREVEVVKKYTDDNGVTRYVVNINNNLTNNTITEAQYLSIINECNREDIIDIPPVE